MSTDPEINGARAELTKLQNEFLVGDEWGIFDQPTRDKILGFLREAGTQLDAKKLPEVDDALMKVCLEFNTAKKAESPKGRSLWYRINNHFGALPLAYTFGLTFASYWIIFGLIKPLEIDVILQQPAFWGLIGAFTKSLYWLQRQIGTGTLRPRFYVYFLVAPAIGLSLGGALWLTTSAGFKLFSKEHSGVDPDWMIVGVLAFFGGYNWEWALKTIEAVSDRIRSTWQK